jgi:cytidylate kinase
LRVYLDGKDVSDVIRRPDASHASSVVATVEGVRDAVVQKLREFARTTSVVMDGRDIGTKVFPGADIKLFLDASVDVRARRRCDEERARGREVSFEQVKAEIEARDRRDRERAATPLVRAEDALLIDSSTLSVDGVVERVLEIVNARG